MSKDPWSIAGKVAVVTGASGGIGEGLTAAFAEAGARVVGLDLDAPVAPHVIGMSVDLTDAEAINETAARIESEVGSVDILVNAAGIAKEGGVLESTPEDWDPVLDVNARGLFLASQVFARSMANRGYGKIVNFASRCAYVGYENFVSYNASKAAVVAITNTMAVELADAGVRVNAVAPGFVQTPMIEYTMQNKELYQRLISRIPAGRFGTPAEVASLVLFLSSSHSDYVTGTTIPIDGGMLVA